MVKKNNDDLLAGTNVFWMFLLFINLGSLLYLAIWSWGAESLKAYIIFGIFFSLIITGLIVSKSQIFKSSNWQNDCLLFWAGLLTWIGIGSFAGSQVKSVLSISNNNLLSTITGEIPQLLDFTSTAFIVPVSEEILWMLAFPILIIGIMTALSKSKLKGISLKFFSNKIFQIIVIVLITSWTFAIFHVGNQALSFIIAAMLFRSLQVFLIFGDKFFDIIKFATMTLAFSTGAHIGNNWLNYGLLKGFTILNAHLFPVGVIVYGFFAFTLIVALNQIGEKLGQ